jgi:hypothetical protein
MFGVRTGGGVFTTGGVLTCMSCGTLGFRQVGDARKDERGESGRYAREDR